MKKAAKQQEPGAREMKLDRQYQNDLLTFLLNDYPGYEKAYEYCNKLQKEDEDKYMANVVYLQNHELVEDGAELQFSADGRTYYRYSAFPQITHKGIDFMLQDGGLSAILNVQTIKLHEETIRDLLNTAITASNLSEAEKTSVKGVLAQMSIEGLKSLTTKLLDKGISNLPALIQQVQNIF